MEEQFEFDFNEILNQFRNGKKLTEVALEVEVESHIVMMFLVVNQKYM